MADIYAFRVVGVPVGTPRGGLVRPDGQAASTERRQAPLDLSSWALQERIFSVEKLGYLLDRLHPQPDGAKTGSVLVANHAR